MKQLCLLCTLLLFGSAFATIHTVNLTGLAFSPANITILQGDTVRWVKTSGLHNVRESGGTPDTVFYSGAATSSPFTYQFVFNAPLVGTYNYRCDVHTSVGMNGTVTVEAPPCLAPENLAVKWEADDQVTLDWSAPQIGNYDVYGTTDPLLVTPPPGVGWTLLATESAAAPGIVSTILSGLLEKQFIVVVQNCTP
jgi:plastocyanin